MSPLAQSAQRGSVSLPAVKLLRLCLLVLLAVLLPARGAMAAAMVCAPAGMAGHGMPQALHAPPVVPGHAATQAHVHAEHGHGEPGHADHGHADPAPGNPPHDPAPHDLCSACSACCTSPSLPSAAVGIGEPAALASVPFPRFSAPAPSFHSDGQERPPRTS